MKIFVACATAALVRVIVPQFVAEGRAAGTARTHS